MSRGAAARRSAGLLRAGLVGVAGIALMWMTLAVTLAMTLADPQPRLVLALWPAAAVARTAQALALLSTASSPTDTAARGHAAVTLAAGALVREPVLAAAASTLGAGSALGGDTRRADTAYSVAERLSRRDLQSQLWFIERAVRRSNVVGALVHYDIALRANPPFVGAALLPVLAHASAGAAVRRPLIAMLRSRPSWRLPYLSTMLSAPLPPAAIAEQLAGARLDLADPAQAAILSIGMSQLVQAKQYRLAAAILPGRQGGLRNGGFETVPSLLPFDWWLANDDDLTAYREPSGGGEGTYVLRLVSKERGGVLARQLVALPSGRWVLSGMAGGDASPTIAVACAGHDDAPIATMTLSMSASGVRRFGLDFGVRGEACAAQWMTISAPAGASVNAWIDAIRLKRLE